jgi:hypothetical protein
MPDLPDLSQYSIEELIAVKAALHARLEEARKKIIEQAEALELECTPINGGNGRKPGRGKNARGQD